jgi:hypothetical protein
MGLLEASFHMRSSPAHLYLQDVVGTGQDVVGTGLEQGQQKHLLSSTQSDYTAGLQAEIMRKASGIKVPTLQYMICM